MKQVLLFVQAKEEQPELTKPQLWKMIRISDSSLKRIMKDLNVKRFYRHDVVVMLKQVQIKYQVIYKPKPVILLIT